ncbi:MAG: ABC transporter ATP-binding protein [Acidimicrobiia bacterium]|jgi:ABC-2 type transport system ATP-binding protein
MTPATPAIEVADVVKHYGELRALDGLSLTIAPGEVFGLLGPNGAGKTTTVEILEGYRTADAGQVRVLGLDPVRDGARLRPQIGVMLQEGGLYPGLRPPELLRLFAAYFDDPEDPDGLLDVVGLRDAARTMVRRLSGGQRQRLSLALALVGKPTVVFLDEPTAGMDPHARATTWRLIRELADRGVTVMLTTHAMDEAEHLCDRVAIVDHGRIVAAGAPADLTRSIARDEVGFVSEPGLAVDGLAAALGLRGGAAVRESRPGEYVVAAPGSPDLVANLAIWMRDHGHQIDELRTGRRSLEEVFLRLTSEPPVDDDHTDDRPDDRTTA